MFFERLNFAFSGPYSSVRPSHPGISSLWLQYDVRFRGVTYDPHIGVLLHISAQFARILLYTVVGPSKIFVAMYLNGRLCRPEPFAFQLFNFRRTKYLRTNPYSGRPGARSGAAGVLAIIFRVQTTTARGWLHPPRPTHILSSFCRRI